MRSWKPTRMSTFASNKMVKESPFPPFDCKRPDSAEGELGKVWSVIDSREDHFSDGDGEVWGMNRADVVNVHRSCDTSQMISPGGIS